MREDGVNVGMLHALLPMHPAGQAPGAGRYWNRGRPSACRGSTGTECRGTFGPFFFRLGRAARASPVTFRARRPSGRLRKSPVQRLIQGPTAAAKPPSRIRESPAWRGFRCGRRHPTGTEQGGSGIPRRTPTLKRQPDYVAMRRFLSIPATRRQTNGRYRGITVLRFRRGGLHRTGRAA